MNIESEIEKMIAIYYNGNNYIVDGVELSRSDSKLIVSSLMHVLQTIEWIKERHARKQTR